MTFPDFSNSERLRREVEKQKQDLAEKLASDFMENFKANEAALFLKTRNVNHLDWAFTWLDSPQGEKYWEEIHSSADPDTDLVSKIPDEARAFLTLCIIEKLSA